MDDGALKMRKIKAWLFRNALAIWIVICLALLVLFVATVSGCQTYNHEPMKQPAYVPGPDDEQLVTKEMGITIKMLRKAINLDDYVTVLSAKEASEIKEAKEKIYYANRNLVIALAFDGVILVFTGWLLASKW